MKILVASDAFKGTLSSKEVGGIIKKALEPEYHVDVVSVSDGGEGLLESIKISTRGRIISCPTKDPLNRPIQGHYLLLEDGKRAVIESALACGLSLLDESERNPMKTSTFGVGMLMKDAVKKGARKLLIGIGGSSSNDGGTGLLEALGVKFYDSNGQVIRGLCGEKLIEIKAIDWSALQDFKDQISIEVACDVDNVLLGQAGASHTFARQKGASKQMCDELEAGMTNYACVIEKELNKKLDEIPATGAAGGMGMCFISFFDGQLRSGIELLLDHIGFDEKLEGVSCVVTGEGKIDLQTLHGKVASGVSKRCRSKGIPVYAICGINELPAKEKYLFEEVFSVVPMIAGVEESLLSPKSSLEKLIEDVVKTKLLDRLVE